MNLINAVRRECIFTNIQSSDKDSFLKQIAELATSKIPALQALSPQRIYQLFAERESMGTTGFGKGIAIPHCRLPEFDDFVIGIARIPQGLDFDSIDGQPVDLVFFIVGSEYQSDNYVRLLSSLAQLARNQEILKRIREASTPQEIYQVITGYCAETGTTSASQPQSEPDIEKRLLFTCVIQSEDCFLPLLRSLMAVPLCEFCTFEGANAENFLARTPLFAAFWKDESHDFCKILLGSIPERHQKNLIRYIEEITGPLEERDDVLLAMWPVTFLAGGLVT
ncbi:MAG: PTS sugar transporter subunit IIA [Lentisphaerae bacterium]|nr:MAG: PTS sugar transporter subunit IIA [Lentisphaerota bacterium]